MQAIRTDGVKVELHDDGTWTPVDAVAKPKTGTPEASASGFRGVSWGSPSEMAIAREGRKADQTVENALIWAGVSLADLSWTAAYIFVDNQLARGKYLLETEYHNENRYLLEFQRLLDLLEQKYGQPTEKQDVWLGDLYQDTPDEWGMAVSTGDLTRLARWTLASSEVYLGLSGENFETKLVIEYSNPVLAGEEERRKTGESLSDL